MATVYKVEFEFVSEFVNYPPELIKEWLQETIEAKLNEDKHNPTPVRVQPLKVERIA